MGRGMFAVLAVLALWLTLTWGEAATPASEPSLSGPLVKLDVKDAEVATVKGSPNDYLVHNALIKPVPQGEFPYSLAEHAELTADFTNCSTMPWSIVTSPWSRRWC
jgi:hypothetical protein